MSGYPGQGYGPGNSRPYGHSSGYGLHQDYPPPGSPPLQYGYSDQPGRHNKQYAPPPGPPPDYLDEYGMPRGGTREGYHESRSAPPPPSEAQQFGHGAPEGYTFQYSACTGRKKALLIGINYFGQDGELRGCLNDVKNLCEFLITKHGYRRENMVILTDNQPDPHGQPTRANILAAMRWLVANAEPNDSLFFHFSGHGGQTEDLDGDENDGFDEVIYPVDFQENGHIFDDEIHFTMVKPLRAGVRLTAIFDSCHSGSAMDLPYIYSTKGMLKEPNLAREAGEGLLKAFSAYSQGNMLGVASEIFGLAKTATSGNEAYEKTKDTRTSPADVIMWSGSKDNQTSADATINSQATGAMSWAFRTALDKNPEQSYVELLNNIRDLLEEGYSQRPQLSSSHPIDTSLRFIM